MTHSAPFFVLRGADEQTDPAAIGEAALRARLDGGRCAWTFQTWLRLRHAGFAATLAGELPRAGLAILHADDFNAIDRHRFPLPLWTVVCRADRAPVWRADFEIVQNPLQADGRRCFYVHHWPQPGLLPRDTSRCGALRSVGYFGMFKQLPEELRHASWRAQLRDLGCDWLTPGGSTITSPLDQSRIHDYSLVDVVVALRDPLRGDASHKPPTKLLNAWLAGVPAIVSPDPAYLALRTHELDFIEAADAPAALAALRRLRDQPGLYSVMCQRARERAAEFTPAAISARWQRLLTVEIPAARAGSIARLTHPVRALASHGQRVYTRLNRHRFRHYAQA
jgi:hypothetical protein